MNYVFTNYKSIKKRIYEEWEECTMYSASNSEWVDRKYNKTKFLEEDLNHIVYLYILPGHNEKLNFNKVEKVI